MAREGEVGAVACVEGFGIFEGGEGGEGGLEGLGGCGDWMRGRGRSG